MWRIMLSVRLGRLGRHCAQGASAPQPTRQACSHPSAAAVLTTVRVAFAASSTQFSTAHCPGPDSAPDRRGCSRMAVTPRPSTTWGSTGCCRPSRESAGRPTSASTAARASRWTATPGCTRGPTAAAGSCARGYGPTGAPRRARAPGAWLRERRCTHLACSPVHASCAAATGPACASHARPAASRLRLGCKTRLTRPSVPRHGSNVRPAGRARRGCSRPTPQRSSRAGHANGPPTPTPFAALCLTLCRASSC